MARTKRVTVIAWLLTAVIALVMFFTAGYFLIRKLSEESPASTDGLLAQVSLRFDGQEITAYSGSLTAPDGSSVFVPAGEMPTIVQNDFKGGFTFASVPVSNTVTIEETGFEGNAEGFESFIPEENGDFTVTVSAVFEQAEFSGEITWKLIIRYDANVSFGITATEVVSGDAFVLYGENLRSSDLTVTLDYPYEPHITFLEDGGCVSYIPVNHLRTTGDYVAHVTYMGEKSDIRYHVTEAEFSVQHLTVDEGTRSGTVGNSTAQDEYSNILIPLFESFDDNFYWEELFIQPVEGEVTTDYGAIRYTNDDPTPSRHAGVDFAAAQGTPIAASNSGKVLYAGKLIMTGNTVLIEHGMGLHTLYYHMDSLACETGDMVRQGDIVGTVGMTGYATGPHLHFEVMVGFQSINPWHAFDGTSGFYKMRDYL